MSLGLVRNRSYWFVARGVTPDPPDAGTEAAGTAASESTSNAITIKFSVHNGSLDGTCKSKSGPVCQCQQEDAWRASMPREEAAAAAASESPPDA